MSKSDRKERLRERIGDYVVEAEIGRGGMGVVYRARDPRLGRQVAIKALLPGMPWDQDARARLGREARALASVNHPNVATIHGIEDWQGTPHLVLELVEGPSLAEILRGSVLPRERAVAICAQVALGLAALHERGLVHRDLKPDNVRVTTRGVAKVLDFGLAKPAHFAAPVDASQPDEVVGGGHLPGGPADPPDGGETPRAGITVEGRAIGTPGYMSPEQVRGRPVDAASDAWAWGCLVYEVLSGVAAYKGPAFARLRSTLQGPPDWSLLPGDLPAGARSLLERCFASDPAARPLPLDLAAAELEASFDAANRTQLASVVRGNLPRELTTFVGREREVEDVARLARAHALVTLTGPGGSGKTRLAIEVARELESGMSGGAWLVELALVRQAAGVERAVSSALGVREQPGRTLEEALAARFDGFDALIVLDNCEHLISAVARLASSLVAACPSLRIIATSQELLRVQGEVVHAVAPLSVPEETAGTAAEVLASESVRLFVDRARLVSPAVLLDDDDAAAIARVCRRVDGIPLALELAAARLNVLTPRQLADRLEDRFRLLTGGSVGGLPRHQTLRACLDWSHDLLAPAEQILFRRLSTFEGGWTLELAESACADAVLPRGDILEVMAHLVDKSLVLTDARTGRHRMLETIRQHAREKLAASGEQEAQRMRHARAVVAAVRAMHEAGVMSHARRLRLLDAEHANIDAALEWLLHAEGGRDPACRLAADVHEAWDVHGRWSHGRNVLARLLASGAGDIEVELRADLLVAAARLAMRQADNREARESLRTALELAESAGDARIEANALSGLGGLALIEGDIAAAETLFQEALLLRRVAAEPADLARILGNLAIAARVRGDLESARQLVEEARQVARDARNEWLDAWLTFELASVTEDRAEAVSLFERSLATRRQIDDRHGIALAEDGLAVLAEQAGDAETARQHVQRGLAIKRELGDLRGVAWSLDHLGRLEFDGGRHEAARLLACRSLEMRMRAGYTLGAIESLELVGVIDVAMGRIEAGVRLQAAATELRSAGGFRPRTIGGTDPGNLEAARIALGEVRWNRLADSGRILTIEEAAELALAGES